MWQRDSHTVAVRWTLRCVPRLSPGRVAKPLALDGISEYRFDSRGFIREHSVRRLLLDQLACAPANATYATPML